MLCQIQVYSKLNQLYIYIYPFFFQILFPYRPLQNIELCCLCYRVGSYQLSIFFCCCYKFIYLFIYFWLCWVFVSVRGLSLVAASGGHSSLRCAGLSLSWPLLLRSTGSRRAGSVAVTHGPSCSAACGIFPDQGSNPCPLHWQADSQPLHHQGSPLFYIQQCIYVNPNLPIYPSAPAFFF